MEQSSAESKRIKVLKNALEDPDEGVRQKAAESLSRLEGVAEFHTYVSMLDSDDRSNIIQAIYLLAELATEAAIELLKLQIHDPYDDIRAAVIHALRNSSSNYRASGIREKAVDILLTGLGDLNLSIRASAADALARFKDLHSIEALLTVIKSSKDDEDENTQLLVSVLLALGEIGDTSVVLEIIERAEADNPEVKEAALKALGMLGDSRAEDCLIEALKNDNVRIRMQAAESLGRI